MLKKFFRLGLVWFGLGLHAHAMFVVGLVLFGCTAGLVDTEL
jgi:hypothetical protein